MLILIVILLVVIILSILFPNFVKMLFWGCLFLISLALLFLSAHTKAGEPGLKHDGKPSIFFTPAADKPD